MKKQILILVALSTLTATSFAQAGDATFQCETENWVGTQGIKNGAFEGTLAANCVISNAKADSLPSLDQFFLSNVQSVKKVNEGPKNEIYAGLPSVFYNVTTVADQVTMDLDEHIATDGKTKLIYAALSTQVQASGFAGLLKKIDVIVEITPSSDHYLLVLTTTVNVEKPAFVPDSQFESIAESTAHQQFQKNRDSQLPIIASHL